MKLSVVASSASLILLLLLCIGEVRRRPVLMPSITPAAAPRVLPPAKVIPWPQPKEIQGLENGGVEEPPVMGEPEQVFGV